jgi:hypothetical protein
MSASAQKLAAENFSFSSSVAADVWHPKKSASAYEWWYFDALSDDASEAIVIIFLDNFVFSPRYNTREFKNPEAERAANLRERISRRLFNSKSKIQNPNPSFPPSPLFIIATASRFTARLTSSRKRISRRARKTGVSYWRLLVYIRNRIIRFGLSHKYQRQTKPRTPPRSAF